MNTVLNRFPVASRFVLAMLLFGFAIVVSGLVNKGAVKQYFPTYHVCFCLWLLGCFMKPKINY